MPEAIWGVFSILVTYLVYTLGELVAVGIVFLVVWTVLDWTVVTALYKRVVWKRLAHENGKDAKDLHDLIMRDKLLSYEALMDLLGNDRLDFVYRVRNHELPRHLRFLGHRVLFPPKWFEKLLSRCSVQKKHFRQYVFCKHCRFLDDDIEIGELATEVDSILRQRNVREVVELLEDYLLLHRHAGIKTLREWAPTLHQP
ncbi:hypothetical protein [Oceanidesulfovibrio marinus]|uniref:Uncharacterized protein n=1 Tax=Oceanidesulfovibrio marinus TaxID=370038 RepID=A0ABX6NJQ2_9BACT|nr:hypothetical protein [Oceanidesulfovibrio marinus]QJT10813.1 hypothetical protein E8L03_18665 [Oceanidesulfovibrio marinus]